MRALRIELRRSAALWSGLLIVALGLLLFYSLPGPWTKGSGAWTEEWTTLARWQRWQLVLVWPLAFAAGAWQGRRDRRAKTGELMATMPRPMYQQVLPPAIAMAIGAAAAYLLFFAVGAVQVTGNSAHHHLNWLPVAGVGMLSMIAAVLLGMGIGRVVPFLLTAPISGFAALTALIYLQVEADHEYLYNDMRTSALSVLSPTIQDLHEAFTTVAPRVNLLQALWFAAVAATGLALAVAVGRRAKLMALLPVVAAAAVALPLMPTSRAEAYVPDTSAVALICTPDAPRICVSRVHQDELGKIVGPARQGLAELAVKLNQAPTELHENVRWINARGAAPQPPGVETFHLDDGDFVKDVRLGVLLGPEFWCEIYDPTNRPKRIAMAAWFNGEPRPVLPADREDDSFARAESLLTSLRQLPVAEQVARVIEWRRSTTTCLA
jgi:hypothetical protein